jgi:hypothetical protein
MENYAKTLEIINLQHEVARREFDAAIRSPFEYPAAPPSSGAVSEWQPLLDFPNQPPPDLSR